MSGLFCGTLPEVSLCDSNPWSPDYKGNQTVTSGLRSFYTLISESMSEMEYLQPAIGIVLGFIGTKMVFDFLGYHISTEVSLGFVAASISSAVVLSVVKKSNIEK